MQSQNRILERIIILITFSICFASWTVRDKVRDYQVTLEQSSKAGLVAAVKGLNFARFKLSDKMFSNPFGLFADQ